MALLAFGLLTRRRRRDVSVAAILAGVASAGCSGSTNVVDGGPEDGEPSGENDTPDCHAGYELANGVCEVREIYIAGGEFTLGRGYCHPVEQHAAAYELGGGCRYPDEPHTVNVRPFYMDAVEFSLAEGSRAELLRECPAFSTNCISQDYFEAVTFTARENAERNCEERGKRLPTEAEWEFAATAGGTRIYAWGDEKPSCDRARFGSSACGTAAELLLIAQYAPSSEGLYDLAGNSSEIVVFDPTHATPGYPDWDWREPMADPYCWVDDFAGGYDCVKTFYRGGDAGSPAASLRAPERFQYPLETSGYRCVRNAD